MKGIDLVSMISDIGRQLQDMMTFSEIDGYFGRFGIDCQNKQPRVNSKWVYVKEVLADAPESLVLDIAVDLGMATPQRQLPESNAWLPGHFRLFITHVSAFKSTAASLRSNLRRYGISGFIAHQDIEPTKEWEDEIKSALFSMDALLVILSKGFEKSKWTSQEVGIAIGRGALVLSVRRDLDPFGFIGRYQSVQGLGRNIGEVSNDIFQALIQHADTADRMIEALADVTALSQTTREGLGRLSIVDQAGNASTEILSRLREKVRTNEVLMEAASFRHRLDQMLEARNLPAVVGGAPQTVSLSDDDIPF